MSCEVEHRDGVIHISGELTIYAAASVKDAMVAALGRNDDACRVDVSQVSEIDTTGLQWLLMLQKACSSNAREFALTGSSEVVTEALELLHLGTRLSSNAHRVPAPAALDDAR